MIQKSPLSRAVVECDVCFKTLKNVKDLQQHKRDCHSSVIKMKRTKIQPVNLHTCTYVTYARPLVITQSMYELIPVMNIQSLLKYAPKLPVSRLMLHVLDSINTS